MSKIGVWKPEQEIKAKSKNLSKFEPAKGNKKSAEQPFWGNCIADNRILTFRFMDSTEISGRLIAYDNYFILIETEDGKQRLVHKGGLLWAE